MLDEGLVIAVRVQQRHAVLDAPGGNQAVDFRPKNQKAAIVPNAQFIENIFLISYIPQME